MRTCVLCGQDKPEAEYSLRYGRTKKTCDVCCERLKARYWVNKESESPIPFDALIDAYDLTPDEVHAVDMAAGQSISHRRFMNRHKYLKWPGPSAEDVVDAIGETVARRCELLLVASLRARELVTENGLDPKTFFNARR